MAIKFQFLNSQSISIFVFPLQNVSFDLSEDTKEYIRGENLVLGFDFIV